MNAASNAVELFTELWRRPDIDAVDARYVEMFSMIVVRLVTDIGVRPWVSLVYAVNASTGAGREASLGGDGEVRRYGPVHSPGSIPDAEWPRAVDVVAALARAYGFGPPVAVVDRQSDHEVSFPGEYGGELLFGTAVNTTLSLRTGCHLTREAHLRGPSHVEEYPEPVEVAPEPVRPVPEPVRPAAPAVRPVREVMDEDFDNLSFIRPADGRRRARKPWQAPPDQPAHATEPPKSTRRRPRTDFEDEDFDQRNFIRPADS
nr:LppA family lipoprotein [Kibdelosporangium sp. MJ126-NF4]CEL13059.1 hypothetical protein [Kibdelosporangium sp. MJ126-NF4]CTQ98746.1 hypothetical protein [Kibdelosporangium sp. MJ126-NF4]